MARVWFTSDLHFGHAKIGKFRKEITDSDENTAKITEDWFELVHSKRDIVWVLGDIAFTDKGFNDFVALPGEKRLLLGNHDPYPSWVYAKHFKHVYGLIRYKNAWLSHAPIHPVELRGKANLHGHVHYKSLPDKNYFNCCVENLWKETGKSLISLDELRERGVLR